MGEDKKQQTEPDPPKSCMTWRYYTAALVLFANFIMSSSKMALSITLVNMVNSTNHELAKVKWKNETMTYCPVKYNSTGDFSSYKTGGEFNWSPEIQGFILGAGTLGNALAPIFGGSMADTFGAKYVMISGCILGALGMIASPFSSSISPYCMIGMQLIRGIGQGFVMPSSYKIITSWTPRRERGFISSLSFIGRPLGFMVGGMAAGFLCGTSFLGWRSVFYLFGCLAVLFTILFAFTFHERPEDHPWISNAEKEYIVQDRTEKKGQKKSAIPWFKIFSSIKTYALMYAIFGQRWITAYFGSVHPSYMGNILHYPIAKNGLVSSLSFVMVIFGSLTTSAAADWLYRHNCMSIDLLRKGCHFTGCLVFTLSMMGIYFAGCESSFNIVFLATGLLSHGIISTGSRTAVVDMAPNFAATLMGAMSLVINQAGLLVPVLVGFMTKNQTMEQWKTVFLMNMGVVTACGVIYAVFGSAKPQSWNFEKSAIDGKVSQLPETKEHIEKFSNKNSNNSDPEAKETKY